MRHLILATIASAALTFAASGQTVVYVDDDAPIGGDGAAWTTAFTFLQDALASTGGGVDTEIRIAQGTYRPDRDDANPEGSGDRAAHFHLVDGGHLVGGYLGLSAGEGESPDERDPDAYETILSGDLLGDDGPDFENNVENSHHLVRAEALDEAVRLDGIVVRGGNSAGSEFNGGAFRALGPTEITDCVFSSNASASLDGAAHGGAVFIEWSVGFTATGCQFISNRATSRGGAILNLGDMTLVGCEFTENRAESSAAIYGQSSGTSRVIGCSFVRNSVVGPSEEYVTVFGGAVGLFGDSAIFLNCLFVGNTVTNVPPPEGYATAGALGLALPSIVMNCLFVGNVADNGGAVWCQFDDVRLLNCTVVANASADESAAIDVHDVPTYDPPPLVGNCVIVGNTNGQVVLDLANVTYSCVEGGYPGVGNIDAAPQFVNSPNAGPDGEWGTPDDDYGDLRLMSGTPCIDAGHNWLVPQDTLDIDDDDGNTRELLPYDLDGLPRFNADELDFDPGCGTPVVVDMGAYEYQYEPVEQVIYADLTADGVVDVTDLTVVIFNWGPCEVDCCLSDLDMNGVIDVMDLITIITNWG